MLKKLFADTKVHRPILLLVDDNKYVAELLTKILEADYQIHTTTNGAEALTLLHQSVRPDLIITDIVMPGMNGYELIKHLKANGLFQLIPVCILSEIHPHTINAGLGNRQVEAIFTKPFDPDILKNKLENILGRFQEQFHLP